MDAILRQYDEEFLLKVAETTTTTPPPPSWSASNNNNIDNTTIFTNEDINDAIRRLADAFRDVIPLLTKSSSSSSTGGAGDGGGNGTTNYHAINANWLFKTLESVPTAMGHDELAKMVWDACNLQTQSQQEEALFATLGASEEAMAALFEIFPHASEIAQNISEKELGGAGAGTVESSRQNFIIQEDDDPAELERQRLRQEAYDAAQVAAIAQAELDALRPTGGGGPGGGGATHSIARSSEIEAQKAARKAQKRAQQTMARAKAAGAIIEDEEFLALGANNAMSNNVFGQGGLVGRSVDEITSLQQSLLPEGSRKHYNEKGLPHGTERYDDDIIGYEKVTIPPPRLDPSKLHARLRIDDVLDTDCARAFAGTSSLNPMQSTVFDTAFHRRENMLVCAPTGAGKTNVAMLTVTAHFRDVGLISRIDRGNDGHKTALETGQKVVYIAPMKALAQEVVEKFSSKLKPLGLIVRELTGDMQLTRAEAESANVIVTTPEKWDVVTRKSGNDDNSLGNKCGLLIIDEVHLLADDRGAVIESVVARLHRLVESRQKQIRIVGLSATLPNYEDVAQFLQVPEKGLFYFGPEHRPVPLQQTFVGVSGRVTDRNLMERKMNDVCYETVIDSLKRGYQVMVFVHSRKGTSDAARALAERATAAQELDRYFTTQGNEGAAGEAYKRYADRVKKSRNREVANHFYNGMGIHHAGMLRGDRKLTETMFADGAIKVLCCTATLAWGINLPAHTVVIKGTDIYSPEKGKMVDLSILDVQQIFGRAGRPQFDTSGEATLITNHAALSRYLDKMVLAVPIESTFTKQLADHLNSEIVGGTVTNMSEAATWLSYTYLYVRMLKNPLAYGISADQKFDDPTLRGRLMDLVKESARMLSTLKMVSFDPTSGNVGMTTLGRVAAHFYIQAESVATFNDSMEINRYPTDSNLLMMVSSANEFDNLRVRQEEQSELDDLQKSCPLLLEGPVNDSATKTFVLLQAFVSRQRPKGFTLISDTNYIASNASRVSRAIFEMCLHDNKAGPAIKLLRLAKSVDNQFWWFQTPLRYFESELGLNTIKSIETQSSKTGNGYDSLSSTLSLLDMSPEEVGQLCRSKRELGKKVQRFIGMIPKLIIDCHVQPVTKDVVRFQVALTPDFEWHGRWHGGAQFFWLLVIDSQSERIYHQEQFMFTKKNFPESVTLEMYVPSLQGASTQYVLHVLSDSWVGVELVYPVSLKHTNMPDQAVMYTPLQDLTPLPTTVLQDERYEQLFSRIDTFNPVQTQLFHVLYHTDTPVLLGAPTGSGKTAVGELAIMRMKRIHEDGICVYIAPLKSLARERLKEWRERFGGPPMKWNVLELSGDTHHDRRAIEKADILVCTPEKWDLISRGWRGSANDITSSSSSSDNKRSFVKRVRLLVIDEIHLLGEERGAVLEAIVSRTRFISRSLQQDQTESTTNKEGSDELVRIVGLSTAVANPIDLADWIGIETEGTRPMSRRGLYNFKPSIRPVPTTVHVQGYPGKHYCPRMATMNKPCYAAIKQHSPDRPTLIFVASRRQTRLTAFDIISFAAGDDNPKAFLGCNDDYIDSIATSIHDDALRHTITFGIGLHHAGLSSHDRDIVERLYLAGDIRVLVATATLAWGVNLPARLVIVKGTEYFDGKTSRYVDYPLTDVLQMIGRAGRPGFDTQGRAVVLVETSKKNFYKRFLYTPFPVESCLRERLCENLNAEIASRTIGSLLDAVGYLTWTFFARRVKANPSYYGANSNSTEDVEDFLTAVAVETLSRLKEEDCVSMDDNDDVKSTVLGQACSEYYLNHKTPKQMLFGLNELSSIIHQEISANQEVDENDRESAVVAMRQLHPIRRTGHFEELTVAWILYTLCSTHEFDELPVRHNEELLNEDLANEVMWGADTSSLMDGDGKSGTIEPEVYSDSHTKAFLLIQAWLEKAQLPISDYVNDTKTVLDNVPRLLAAMYFVGVRRGETINGWFDVVTQLVRTKQLVSNRSTPFRHPILQIPGFSISAFDSVTAKLSKRGSDSGDSNNKMSFWTFRRQPHDKISNMCKQTRKGTFKKPVDTVLGSLFSLPLVTIKDAKIYHEIGKTDGKGTGTLKLTLMVERESPKKNNRGSRGGREDDFCSLVLVLGSFEKSKLLATKDFPITSQYQKKDGHHATVACELQFDWKTANVYGGLDGGHVVLRLLLDTVRGLDSEVAIPLK
mmetsp:Transcript_14889/g.36486  ORF Transcript_14889/g.36486 Transcript_14889/m.36486 type:complete len:2187 (-) Transcript_14889:153-6713(-)